MFTVQEGEMMSVDLVLDRLPPYLVSASVPATALGQLYQPTLKQSRFEFQLKHLRSTLRSGATGAYQVNDRKRRD